MSLFTAIILFFYLLAIVVLALFGLHRYYLVYLYYKHKNKPLQPKRKFDKLPPVTVQLPIYNEYYVVERLITSVCQLDYPKELLEIQVLDDSTDETSSKAKELVEKFRNQGLDIVHHHRENRNGFKAGALQYGLNKAKGDFLVILDADFKAPSDLLKKSIDFFTDEKIGMVQFRWGHLNRDFSVLTKLQSIFLDGHFMIEQTARHRSGRFFNFNGTAGIWRKEAIASSGGWQSDTLTEDLDLSYRAQLAGWEFIYLADVVCEAELPIEMNSYKTQQHRWAKGSVQTAKKLLPVIWKSSLPWHMKLEATFHLTNNLSYLFMLIPLILILPSLALWLNLDWNKAFLIYTFFFITTTLSVWFYFACSQKEIYKNWKTVLKYLPILLPLGIGLWVNNTKAALEGLWNYKTEFVRTPKYGIEKKLSFLTPLKYQSQHNWVSLAELIFFGYLTLTLVYAWMNKIYVAIPLLLVFQIGFGIVAILSWSHSRKFKQVNLGFTS